MSDTTVGNANPNAESGSTTADVKAYAVWWHVPTKQWAIREPDGTIEYYTDFPTIVGVVVEGQSVHTGHTPPVDDYTPGAWLIVKGTKETTMATTKKKSKRTEATTKSVRNRAGTASAKSETAEEVTTNLNGHKFSSVTGVCSECGMSYGEFLRAKSPACKGR